MMDPKCWNHYSITNTRQSDLAVDAGRPAAGETQVPWYTARFSRDMKHETLQCRQVSRDMKHPSADRSAET